MYHPDRHDDRGEALLLLLLVRQSDREALDVVLQRAAEDTDPGVRARLVSMVPINAEMRTWLRERLVADPYYLVRQKALERLTDAIPRDPDADSVLRDRAARDESPAVRRQSLSLLGGGESTAEFLRERARSDDAADVRILALWKLTKMMWAARKSGPYPMPLSDLEPTAWAFWTSQSWTTSEMIDDVLAGIHDDLSGRGADEWQPLSDPQQLDFIVRAVEDVDAGVRTYALVLLSALAPHSVIVAAAERLLTHDRDSNVQQVAERVLELEASMHED
jgi:hypothetical protein